MTCAFLARMFPKERLWLDILVIKSWLGTFCGRQRLGPAQLVCHIWFRQAGVLWAQSVCNLFCKSTATIVEWVLVSYTLPNQLNLSPSDFRLCFTHS